MNIIVKVVLIISLLTACGAQDPISADKEFKFSSLKLPTTLDIRIKEFLSLCGGFMDKPYTGLVDSIGKGWQAKIENNQKSAIEEKWFLKEINLQTYELGMQLLPITDNEAVLSCFFKAPMSSLKAEEILDISVFDKLGLPVKGKIHNLDGGGYTGEWEIRELPNGITLGAEGRALESKGIVITNLGFHITKVISNKK